MRSLIPKTLRFKLIASFVLTVIVILAANMYMYWNINGMLEKVDAVYMSNVNMNDLAEALKGVQTSMTEYLSAKSSEALEEYYRSVQLFQTLYEQLNSKITDNAMLNLEKNIQSMSVNYIQVTDETVQAKRGRNVEKYKNSYEEASVMFDDINGFIYILNNEKFRMNTTNYKGLMTSLQYMEIITTVILMVIGGVSLGLILLITNSITKPLNRLAKAANEVAKGNFHKKVPQVHNMDEVGIVSKAFNKMVDSIQRYIIEISRNMEREQELKEREFRMEAHLKDAQLKYLQAQINPHFLFNSLNAGVQLAMLEGAERTGEFVENMADFFRYNLKQIKQDTTILEEVRLVDSYLYILNVRYAGEIHYYKEIDDRLLHYKVPSMIIQPLVENAINHGIHGAPWEGKIGLSVAYGSNEGEGKDDWIHITVSDNGKGMSREKIRSILLEEPDMSEELNVLEESKEVKGKRSTGIGLRNVKERLQLYFNHENLLQIESEEMKGTKVTINIPNKREQDVDVPNRSCR